MGLGLPPAPWRGLLPVPTRRRPRAMGHRPLATGLLPQAAQGRGSAGRAMRPRPLRPARAAGLPRGPAPHRARRPPVHMPPRAAMHLPHSPPPVPIIARHRGRLRRARADLPVAPTEYPHPPHMARGLPPAPPSLPLTAPRPVLTAPTPPLSPRPLLPAPTLPTAAHPLPGRRLPQPALTRIP